ncbi:hypothetical protein [Metabacillus fastidiosus]|uniref:hypothetical protein n=1 Tax=Metabacillus fastidiosus TaxID=1458 RepID=UPI003D2B64D6
MKIRSLLFIFYQVSNHFSIFSLNLYDALGTGDQIYISLDEGENPPVHRVYHDVSEQPDEILSVKRLIANSLSELFNNAKVTFPLLT